MEKNQLRMAMLFALVLPLISVCWAGQQGVRQKTAEQGPLAAERGLAADGKMQISAHDRCPVCGMFPVKRPKSAAALQLTDGRAFYFCGNGCLLRSWRNSKKYLGAEPSAIGEMRVRDYFTGESIDARIAWWVAGSDVIGPMGPAIVALKQQKNVEVFKKRHGGRYTFQLDQVDDALWKNLSDHKK